MLFNRTKRKLIKWLKLIVVLWIGMLVMYQVFYLDIRRVRPTQLFVINMTRDQDNHEITKIPMRADVKSEKVKEEQFPFVIEDGNDGGVNKSYGGQQIVPLQPPELHKGLGELGVAVKIDIDKLTPQEQWKYNDGMKHYGFNEYLSEMISLHRSLPDFRHEKCKEPGRYPKDLPDTSIIICFHDESWSALLRSVHSIIERTPSYLLKEIILIDDFSSMDHLKRPLEKYIEQFINVKIIRTLKREGLIRARIIGAEAARGTVLTFLDSHIECTEGWLEPLLATIHRNPTAAVAPVIEVINEKTFELKGAECEQNSIGGLDWTLTFDWHGIPERIAKSLSHPCDPIPSPTMAGGLFSIRKDFFQKLGYYDNQLDVWGGENLELSFKVWMCGGKLFQLPCSHVGHIFRSVNPYSAAASVQFGNFVRKNSLRVAEVWLDEYKEIFYERTGKVSSQIGNLTEAIAKRKELGCHSFDWYLTNVYPEMYIPRKGPAFGQIRNMGAWDFPICLASPGSALLKPITINHCRNKDDDQFWDMTIRGEIRNFKGCLDYSDVNIILYDCHGMRGNQLWVYKTKTKQLYHKLSGKCLAVDNSEPKNLKLSMDECSSVSDFNQWIFSNMKEDALQLFEKSLM